MGIKEGVCFDEHWVTYGSAGSLYCTPQTNTIFSVNWTLKQNLKKHMKTTFGISYY